MIDIENAVVNKITLTTRTQYASTYPGLKIYSLPPELPESFPCVSIELLSDTTTRTTLEFGKASENHADLTFQVDVYANDGDKRKETAKTIFNFVDSEMQKMGFVRSMAMPTPNIDRSVYRITGRYTGRSDSGTTDTVNGVVTTTYTIFK